MTIIYSISQVFGINENQVTLVSLYTDHSLMDIFFTQILNVIWYICEPLNGLSLNCNGASVVYHYFFCQKKSVFNKVLNDSKITEKRNATNQFATTTAVTKSAQWAWRERISLYGNVKNAKKYNIWKFDFNKLIFLLENKAIINNLIWFFSGFVSVSV